MTDQPTFADFPLCDDLVAALADAGMLHPFPIQAMTLPVALSGHDIIGQAKTGTGKTLGFTLPALNRLIRHEGAAARGAKPQALIIVPTRELAIQVAATVTTAAARTSIRVEQIYGGRPMEPQIASLKRGVEIVVGTPGRVLDLNKQGHLKLDEVATMVLDEADEMLDLGFLPDIERILALTPSTRQTMLFSATMPGAVVALARRYMNQPTHIRAVSEDGDSTTVAAIEHFVYRAHPMDKTELIARILQAKNRGLTMIFTTTKRTAAKLTDDLTERGFSAGAIHGDLGQGAREQALRAFRNGKVDILVATDVAARGIDVDDVTHVINYQCPDDEKAFVHRTGRTGRAGKTGVAVTLVDWDELHRWGMIDKALGLGIPDAQETYSSSDHLFSDLDIERSVSGTLPRSQRTRQGLDAEEAENLDSPGRRRGRSDDKKGRSDGRRDRSRGGDRRDANPGTRDGARTEDQPPRTRNRRRTRRGVEESAASAAQQPGSNATSPGGRASKKADDAPTKTSATRKTKAAPAKAPVTLQPEVTTTAGEVTTSRTLTKSTTDVEPASPTKTTAAPKVGASTKTGTAKKATAKKAVRTTKTVAAKTVAAKTAAPAKKAAPRKKASSKAVEAVGPASESTPEAPQRASRKKTAAPAATMSETVAPVTTSAPATPPIIPTFSAPGEVAPPEWQAPTSRGATSRRRSTR